MTAPESNSRVTIIGAGLVGGLLATLLARAGFLVDVFEARPDPRRHGFAGGRSINLSLVERGLRPLRMAGLADTVLRNSVMMRGRMVHALDGSTNLQRYGINDAEVDHSVGRGDLNLLLLDAAERAGARLRFGARLVAVDFGRHAATFEDPDGVATAHPYRGPLLGCDGAGSALRAAMQRATPLGERVEPLGHGYRELEIPPLQAPSGAADSAARFALEPHALHIWPRGDYMCIALPNTTGNFTVTLFLAREGASPSFATLPDPAAARSFFARQFADALAVMPDFATDWARHPTGQLATLYLGRWHLDGRAVLLGDAAHAVVPFHGQGMNAGFEDAGALAALLAEHPADHAAAFARFAAERKPNADAIAAMSLANYVEMRNSVADPRYLLKRELTAALTARAPAHFMSRYRMVSFTSIPYATCRARARTQEAFMDAVLGDRASLAGLDLDAIAAQARAALPALPERG